MLAKYLVIRDFRAPSVIKPAKGESLQYRDFKEGQIVTGYIRDTSFSKIPLAPQIVAFDKWSIPLSYLNKRGDVAQHIPDKDVKMNFEGMENAPMQPGEGYNEAFDNNTGATLDAQKMAESIEKIKNNDLLKSVVDKSKKSSQGLIIGMIGGALLGFYYNKNVVVSAVLGGIAGGYIGSKISKK